MIIAADGGCRTLAQLGITPDIAVGDFDSLGCTPELGNVIRLNPVKDTTDTAEAVKIGLENNCGTFLIYGGTGGRTEHTIANMQTAVYLSRLGKNCFIFDDGRIITVVTDASAEFSENFRGYISVFAADTSVSGVSEKGLKYALENAELTNSFPLGVSNEFTGQKSEVSVKHGTLYIIFDGGGNILPQIKRK